MENAAQNGQSQEIRDEAVTKMLGAHVPVDLYWEFKKAAAARNEQLKDAIEHAARIYIDTGAKGGK